MTVYEVMSIVAISLTALTSVSAIIIPLIINRKNTKEQRQQSERNQQYELIQSTINEFMSTYAEWGSDETKIAPLRRSLYKTMLICSESTKYRLSEISNFFYTDLKTTDLDYKLKEALDLLILEFHIKPLNEPKKWRISALWKRRKES